MNEYSIPAEINVTVLLDESPLPGAWVFLTFLMRRKNPYQLIFGPSSEAGDILISCDDMTNQIHKVRGLALMDYVDLSTAWTGIIEIRPLNLSDVERALGAYQIYGGTGFYPPRFVEDMEILEQKFEKYGSGELTVQVVFEGSDGIKLVVQPQTVW